MKCACGNVATQLAEYSSPGRPETKRYICDAPTCAPKDKAGWSFYPAVPK